MKSADSEYSRGGACIVLSIAHRGLASHASSAAVPSAPSHRTTKGTLEAQAGHSGPSSSRARYDSLLTHILVIVLTGKTSFSRRIIKQRNERSLLADAADAANRRAGLSSDGTPILPDRAIRPAGPG